jgi:hypothetical protein
MTDALTALALVAATVDAVVLALRARDRRLHERRMAARLRESIHLAATVRADLAKRRHFA